MAANYIVLRGGVDWLNFDLEQSRVFCRTHGLADDVVIRFAADPSPRCAKDRLFDRTAANTFRVGV